MGGYGTTKFSGRREDAVTAFAVNSSLGPVDTYRIHKMMAARVTTA
jgi:hypothetical protein